MRTAYLILAHRYPNQLIRMINRLDAEGNTFFIHLDKRMGIADFELVQKETKGKSNIFLSDVLHVIGRDMESFKQLAKALKKFSEEKLNLIT